MKEFKILNYIKNYLSFKVTKVVHLGKSSELFPYNFTINEYIKGDSLNNIDLKNKKKFILDLCKFLNKLYLVPIIASNIKVFNRGAHPSYYTNELFQLINLYEK